MNTKSHVFRTMDRPHEPSPVVELMLFIRNQGDIDVGQEVIYGDGYHLQRLKASGLNPKTIVDIGANIGCFSAFAHALWPDAKIIAVEPHPSSFELLKMNCPWAELRLAAVGDSHCPLVCDNVNFGGASMHFGTAPALSNISPVRISCEHLLKNGPIDLLKLDCEGAEYSFIESIPGFQLVRCIIGEYHMRPSTSVHPFYALRRIIQDRLPHLTVITDADRDPESELGSKIGPFLAFDAIKDRALFDTRRTALPPQPKE